MFFFFFFKQKTAYEMRISDWSSDVCSSDLSGQQFMGDAHESSELLAIKRPGQPFQAFPVAEHQLQAMGHYTASVAVHSDLRLEIGRASCRERVCQDV